MQPTRFHYGVDFGSVIAPYGHGQAIRAISSGAVSATGYDSGNGNFVRIHHNDGRESVYAHLETVDVVPNTSILAGYQIGTMNCTGSCFSDVHGQNAIQGTHLHLEVLAYVGAPRTPEGRIDPMPDMEECE
jgi:murein DD-endopeptidase MepM/ murein hydrolase activator NlpD